MKQQFNFIKGVALSLFSLILFTDAFAQSKTDQKKILVDVGHGQKFWHDPNDMPGQNPDLIERVKYMSGELTKNANNLKATLSYQKGKFTTESLKDVNVLFLQGAGGKFDQSEVTAITDFVKNGGGLFITMDEDYWGTLEQININDIVKQFGIEFKQNNPNQTSGGYAKPGVIARERWSIPVHGARIVEGGTPFCFINTDESTFGVYKEISKGGRIVAMGDGMSSLYMNQWENVNNYQCQQFMGDVLTWLMK
ncbi:hypothetical protein WBG78_13905 [Chryseolinea sp. T2]|uniref:hypothetical protein n=1 Tax=Chryseolinea sp. T2 TaxID=3129255 RepID=UPI003077B16F